MQGFRELFSDTCGGVIAWLNGASYYTAFTEGWALYAENPLIAEETDTYDNDPLQLFGMLKWQIWRALRLIMDTGLHYRGLLEMFPSSNNNNQILVGEILDVNFNITYHYLVNNCKQQQQRYLLNSDLTDRQKLGFNSSLLLSFHYTSQKTVLTWLFSGMKRWEALKLFADKAWDKTDKAVKDVTRYQSVPGQATAYMIGQLKIWQVRNETKAKIEESKKKFSEKDFHYQVLSQGSSPLSYLEHHLKTFADCVIKPDSDGCEYITGYPGDAASEDANVKKPDKPFQPHPYDEHYE